MRFWPRWLGRSKVNPVHPHDPALAEMFGLGRLSASGASVTPDTALRVVAVYACVRVLAQTIAQVPLHVYRRTALGGVERATDHPLYRILHLRPNALQTSFEWRETHVMHTALRGDSYSRIVSDNAGRIIELMPLHPDRVWPIVAEGKQAYRYQPPSGPEQYLVDDEVLRLPHMTAAPGERSLSPIALHRETIGLSLTSTEYQANLWGNSAVSKGGIKTPATLGKEAIEALRAQWENRHAGAANAGRVAIFHGGLDWVNIGMTHEDAQYVELMQFAVSDIARLFGVQPHKIGDLSKSTFSNIEQQAIEFIQNTIQPWVARWEQRMTTALLSESDQRTYKIEFDLNGLLRGDSAARAALYRVLFAIGALKPNDARRLEALDPIDDPSAEKTYVQINMAPLDALLDVLMKNKDGAAQPAMNGEMDDDDMPRANGTPRLDA